MNQSKTRKPGPTERASKRDRTIFLTMSALDMAWLKAEAGRREKERMGLDEEPVHVKVQPVIYDLIRRARIAATATA